MDFLPECSGGAVCTVHVQPGSEGPRVHHGGAAKGETEPSALRHRWALPAGHYDVLLGDFAFQGKRVGLAGRSVLADPVAGGAAWRVAGWTGRAGAEDRKSPDQLSDAERPEFPLSLHPDFLCVCRALCKHGLAARSAAIAVW